MLVNVTSEKGIARKFSGILPARIIGLIRDELLRLGIREDALFEIRLRKNARSSVLSAFGVSPLSLRLGEEDMSAILSSLTGGALYAHRDTLLEGYISPREGLRVGVCARARYDGGKEVGVSDISAFIFRISHSHCDFADELYSVWRARGSGGLLIYSPPGGGKTTAIRSLAGLMGKNGTHVVAVDERCEFVFSEYEDAEVDILRGFNKSKGIEIAVRTLGAEIVFVDEIGPREAEGVLCANTLGVPLIATVHARSAEEILKGPAFSPFVRAGVFETLVGIQRVGNTRRILSTSLKDAEGRVKLYRKEGCL